MKRVLYIEDSDAAQRVMGAVMRHIGIELVIGNTARRGIEIFTQFVDIREGAFDLLIIDGELPDAMGWDVVQALRWIRDDLPPVLVYAGDTSEPLRELWRQAGVTEFLQKPADLEVLAGTIRRLLEPAPTAR